jgi:hypothetical protein
LPKSTGGGDWYSKIQVLIRICRWHAHMQMPKVRSKMKKAVLLSLLTILLIRLPVAAIADKITTGEAVVKLQNEQIDVHLENYGVRHISYNGRLQSIELYKIIIGDPLKLKSAMSLNKENGFDGLIFTTFQDQKDDWHKIRVHRPVKKKKGWKETSIVKKDRLPYPFNKMSDELLNKIQFFNVYPDNDDVVVVYVIEGTKFADCEKMFHFIYEKKKNRDSMADT